MNKWQRISGFLALLAMPLLTSQGLMAAIIHVGAGTDCDAATLEAAVSQAAATSQEDEIRLNYGEGTLYDDTALVLTDFGPGGKGALTFVGGFGSCSDTSPSPTPVEIRGTASNPVVTVNTASSNSVVTFRNVTLQNSGTHGLVVAGNSTVTLDNARSRNNAGSGIRVTSGGWVDLINVSRVTDNATNGYGGGIYCQNADVNIISGLVQNNSAASGGGGGVYASNCYLEVRRDGGISGNTAIDGGGIYADQGSSITILGTADGRPAINNNIATDDGGAIYAKNPGTSVVVVNGRFDGNQAVSRGGALFMSESAVLMMFANEARCRRPGALPTVPTRCSTMLSNTMSPGGQGVAIYAASGSENYIGHTYLEDNDGGSSLIYVTDSGTKLYLEGSSIWNNAVQFLQDGRNGSHLSSAFVSGAHNRYDASGTLTDADVLQLSSATAEIHSSVYQGGSFLGTSGLSGRCLMASNSTPLVSGVDYFTLQADPGFVDVVGGNLRLEFDSPAIDYCDDAAYSPFWNDIDMQPRGVDLPGNPAGSAGVAGGLFDLGFDELHDPVFRDRFQN